MRYIWLHPFELGFPPADQTDRQGIVALGGDLSPERLLKAYALGIFPWFNPGNPIMWWCPDPRFVLYPAALRVSKSMRPYFNQPKYTLTYDTHFREVMTACSGAERPGQRGGTWISEDMIDAYTRLHELGYAHSVEVWRDEALVGGLYGVALGKVFFGESMFTRATNASKFAFISLVRQLQAVGYDLIDCQQRTQHLASLGGNSVSRADFLAHLRRNEAEITTPGPWTGGRVR